MGQVGKVYKEGRDGGLKETRGKVGWKEDKMDESKTDREIR